MRSAIVLGALVLAVSGCALLPAPVQIASLAADGISYIFSKKSVTDHGLSIVMQQNCALWRGVTEGRFCTPDDAATMIAETEDAPDQAIADFETAAGAIDNQWEPLVSHADGIPGPYLTIEPEAAPERSSETRLV